jgi:hypothetical protein
MSLLLRLDQAPRGIRFDDGPSHVPLLTTPTVAVQRACHDAWCAHASFDPWIGFSERGLTKRHCGQTEWLYDR